MRLSTLLFAALAFVAVSSLAASPVRTWKTKDDKTGLIKSHVTIYKYNYKGKEYYGGKIIKLINPSEPNPLCTKCPGAKKNKPIIGLSIIWGMQKDGDDYSGGKIMDPNNGKVYTCKFWKEGANLKVRGYIGPFYRTQTWYPG